MYTLKKYPQILINYLYTPVKYVYVTKRDLHGKIFSFITKLNLKLGLIVCSKIFLIKRLEKWKNLNNIII